MIECRICLKSDDCTSLEKRLCINDDCEEFMEDFYSCLEEDGTDNWGEFSYNRYNETLLDYGEPSDWDIYENLA